MNSQSYILFLIFLCGILLLGMSLVVSGFYDRLITLVSGVIGVNYGLTCIIVKDILKLS